MPTVCLRFRFEEHPKIRALMEACADIQRQTVDYALENGKTATFTIIQALYPSLPAPLGLSGPTDGEDRMGWRDPDRHDPGLPPGSGSHYPYFSPSSQVSSAAG